MHERAARKLEAKSRSICLPWHDYLRSFAHPLLLVAVSATLRDNLLSFQPVTVCQNDSSWLMSLRGIAETPYGVCRSVTHLFRNWLIDVVLDVLWLHDARLFMTWD